jgi:1-acyl-sn-glycerol-3-phosphate acyltransferase
MNSKRRDSATLPPADNTLSFGFQLRRLSLNVYFWIVVPLFALVFIPLGTIYVIFFLLAVRSRRSTRWLIRRSISRFGAFIIRCPAPWIKVRYIDFGQGDKSPFVFVCNHLSASDPFLMAVLPFECIQVLNIWPSRLPVINVVSRIAGYLRVREMPVEMFLAEGSKLLQEQCNIIAFPEGTRSRTGKMGPFHGSAFRLAQQNGVGIVPIAITGNERIPPRGSLILNPGVITISKLPAITAEQYKDLNTFQLKTMARDMIEKHLESLHS